MGLQNLITRNEPRHADHRELDRFVGQADRAILHFRGQPHLVRVVNISERGTMVETNIKARIGESIVVQFENCSGMHAFVRWIKDGKIGLNFGGEIVLEP